MALRLPRFLRSIPLVEENRTPSLAFHQWWDATLKQIETSVSDIELALAVAGVALDDAALVTPFETRTVTTNTALTASDCLVLVDATSGNVTIDLPPALGKNGFEVIIKKIDSTANTVTVEPNGAETIEGAANKVLTTQYEVCRTASDGATWWLV